MHSEQSVDEVRAVVVKLYDAGYTERAWIACSMSIGTWEILSEDEWQQWRAKALDLCLADWREYEIREVTLRVPQEPLESLFSTHAIDVEVSG